MKNMTTIAAAVTLATVSASAGAWGGNPRGDQTQMLDAQRQYAERLIAERARIGEQMAVYQTQVNAAQQKYVQQLHAAQTRIAEQVAAQQAEAQAEQRKYAQQLVAAQARIAEHLAAQQASAQAAQLEYAKLMATQQAQILEAQRSLAQRFGVNRPALAQDGDMVSAMFPHVPIAGPFRADPISRTSLLNPYGDTFSTAVKERIKASEARRGENRKTMDARRTEMESRREAALKKLQERRLTRPHYVGLRKPSDEPAREEI